MLQADYKHTESEERMTESVAVGGVPFRVTNLSESVSWLLHQATNQRAISVRLANAYSVALADKDADYRDVLVSDGVNLPDGTPVIWFMRGLKSKIASSRRPGRVRGTSLFLRAMREGQATGTTHFFLGATPEALRLLVRRVRVDMPDLKVGGAYAPPFGPVTPDFIRECAELIRQANADVVWLGLGTPKQDFVSAELAPLVQRPCVGVGAAFDFVAGTVREAPQWVQNAGLEWAYRLLREPRRLWRRYLFGNTRFLKAAIWPRTPTAS